MPNSFIPEFEVYQLLKQANIKIPQYSFIQQESDCSNTSFSKGQAVVLKGMATELWHKSDNGALAFCDFSESELKKRHINMSQTVGKEFPWLGTLVTERVSFKSAKGAPSEMFVSLQRDKCCGAIITLGFGGLLTEEWAKELNDSLLIWPASVYSPAEALAELEEHWLGRILLGKVRQQEALISRGKLSEFLENIWKLDAIMGQESIGLLEMNPFVVDVSGDLIALDGVGLYAADDHQEPCPIPFSDDSFLNPQRIAIAGVSEKQGNVGSMILDNVRKSNLLPENLYIIKPGMESLNGMVCLPDVSALLTTPVDTLILALPAKSCVETINALCEQGGGANVVYIVAGGLGDGADQHGYGDNLSQLLQSRRVSNKWCPAIVGPNGLGMILSPLKLNSLFIPQDKLNINFDPNSQVALISQSGAFLITRLSRHDNLSLKYGFSIGNQLDMKLSDFMALMERDKSIRVLAMYVEGFVDGDACAVAKLVKQFKAENRHVIIYKGGRSELGKAAAEGHTGAMTGDYQQQKRLLSKAGATVVETFNQFNAVFKWMTAYPETKTLGQMAIVTNAGYETVGSVDSLGDNDAKTLLKIDNENAQQLTEVLTKHRLNELVASVNPLDLTPMADEAVYFDCVKSMIDFGAGVVMLGLVPLSNQLDTQQLDVAETFAKNLKDLVVKSGKLIGIVIDAGIPFQQYKQVFERHGLPVFDGMDKAVLGINVLKRSR